MSEEELRKKAEESERELRQISEKLDKSKEETKALPSECAKTIQESVEDAKKKSTA